jgi:hypothetical protein
VFWCAWNDRPKEKKLVTLAFTLSTKCVSYFRKKSFVDIAALWLNAKTVPCG